MNYYNEYDKKAAAWLRELIKAGLIPAGTVDERSIVDVKPEELKGFTQCHFFAGIGGWSLALQLAGVGPDEPVWTGSCPCQPFSSAGKGKGTDDERHLWPEFARLIGECKPPTVFGEQVASKAGREWFDGVSTDLEDMGYAAAAADLCAAGVNAPHIRQRLFWVADAANSEAARQRQHGWSASAPQEFCRTSYGGGGDCGLDHADSEGRCGRGIPAGASELGRSSEGNNSGLADAEPVRTRAGEPDQQGQPPQDGCGRFADMRAGDSGLGDTDNQRPQGQPEHEPHGDQPGRIDASAVRPSGATGWHDFDLVRCVEPTKEPGRYVEKRRRIEPGTVPLAHGIPGRVGLLRGYGNAIVPQVAAEFIQAYLEIKSEGTSQ